MKKLRPRDTVGVTQLLSDRLRFVNRQDAFWEKDSVFSHVVPSFTVSSTGPLCQHLLPTRGKGMVLAKGQVGLSAACPPLEFVCSHRLAARVVSLVCSSRPN